MRSISSTSIRLSATLDPPVPLPGTIIFRTTPFLHNSAISLSATVAFFISACTCAIVTVGGKPFLKFNISAIRTLLKPPFSGIGSNMCSRAYLITCATSRNDRSVVRSDTSPRSSRRSPKKSSSSTEGGGSGLEWDRWMGLRRFREAKGEDAELLRRGFLLLGLVIREE